MTSGAGIIIPPSLGPAVEFSGSEFDAKVVRKCRLNPVADSGRIKRNSSERKRSDFHGFPRVLALTSYTASAVYLAKATLSSELLLSEICRKAVGDKSADPSRNCSATLNDFDESYTAKRDGRHCQVTSFVYHSIEAL